MSTTIRMKEYLEYRKIPVARAEKACGLGNATLASAFKNNGASIGSEILERFLNVYPDVSAEWLLRGMGSMIIGESKAKTLENKINQMSQGRKNADAAYDVILSIADMVTKTYAFFEQKDTQ